MCGLAGVAGDTDSSIKDGFTDLLTITQLRGRDATGVFSVRKDNSAFFMKNVGTPENITDRKSYDSVLLKGWPIVLAGHCRAKTVGENTPENAHPYDLENVMGMHNGTLNGHYQMEGYNYKDTDSKTLFMLIDKYGPEAIRDLNPGGAWALVWWDKRDKTLNFIRNDKRPLWFAWTKDKRAMVWSSEPWMFGAMGRKSTLWNGVDEGAEPRSPYFELPPDQLWSFSINADAKAGEKVMTLHPIQDIKAEGKYTGNFSPTYSQNGNNARPGRVPFDWEKKKAESTGGEVSNPFQFHRETLDDPVSDIGKVNNRLAELRAEAVRKAQGQLPALLPPGATKTPAVSGPTGTTVTPFRKPLSKTSDTPTDSTHGTKQSSNSKSSRPILSKRSQQDSKKSNSGESNSCTTHDDSLRKKVDVRTVAGIQYITDMKTGTEWSSVTFESNTGAVCSHCLSPIGSLSEVAEFFDRGQRFICTTCTAEPTPLVMVG